MDKIENLLKIINKAIDNGFNYCEWQYYTTAIPICGLMEGNVKQLINTNYYKLLLLDKEFAKAFWGEKQELIDKNGICFHCGVLNLIQPHPSLGCSHIHYPEDCDVCRNKTRDWQYYMKSLVLEDDLITYYAKFLEK